ncbi:multidrug effflux MFS transporter [Algicella marina]|uniref:Bcr/CflA family efflux transporter n=1 Tax=Algicella marina TaxID=2683284 RepID=A0A6P1SZ60_9RHOB|nr:multidrug effflux MFS transporter [Algicella marina]QHQ35974.1 Bcr/CflA family efflux MFS transporter [Algicella marina]
MARSSLRIAFIIGLLASVGPFAIDMYLPALPAIGAGLGAEEATVMMTLTFYFVAFGVAQLVYGPWADQSGRRMPLYFGLGLFCAASLGCALAPSVGWLILFRFIQGLGAASVMVIPRAIVRDLHTGPAATRLMATVMLVISVSPMLAPLAGSGVIALVSWRWIFVFLAALAVFSLFLTGTQLGETLPPEKRRRANRASLMAGAKTLFRDPFFMGLTFIGGFGMASFFVFIASASFVYTSQFGLSEVGFSLAFAVNAIGFFGTSQLAGALGERFGQRRVVRLAVSGFGLFTVANLAFALGFGQSLPAIMVFLFLGNACLGLVIPTAMVLALDEHGDIAGLASSLGGTIQMVTGGVMIAVMSPFFDGTALPMLVAIAICGVVAFALAQLTLARTVTAGQPG